MTDKQMTKRLYYTDPLQAAWMAREFGVEYKDLENVFDDIDDYIMVLFDNSYFDIHPESLPIFQPRVGDLIRIEDGFFLISSDPAYQRMSMQYYSPSAIPGLIDMDYEIIQRDGKAFFMPLDEGDELTLNRSK